LKEGDLSAHHPGHFGWFPVKAKDQISVNLKFSLHLRHIRTLGIARFGHSVEKIDVIPMKTPFLQKIVPELIVF
jgi:hypothetical protein